MAWMNIRKNNSLEPVDTLQLMLQASARGWADFLHVQSRAFEDKVMIVSFTKGKEDD